jgi:hypothetical protein
VHVAVRHDKNDARLAEGERLRAIRRPRKVSLSRTLAMLDGNRAPRRRKYIDADYLLAALFMLVVVLIAKG